MSTTELDTAAATEAAEARRRAHRARRRDLRGVPRPGVQRRRPGPRTRPGPALPVHGLYATFSDPDGNEWLLQQVATCEPGRVTERPVARLAGLLLETALHHGRFEKATPTHDSWEWYAPYLDARQRGSTPEQATAAADRYMEQAHGAVVSR